MQLSREIGVQSRSAWYMLHRIRQACSNSEYKLNNVVEVDKSFIRSEKSNTHKIKNSITKRDVTGKVPITEAKGCSGDFVSKLSITVDGNIKCNVANQTVQAGAIVYTDNPSIYDTFPSKHDSVDCSEKEWKGSEVYVNGDEKRVSSAQTIKQQHSTSSSAKATSLLR